MLLEEKQFQLSNFEHPNQSFLIDHFTVPTGLDKLIINLNLPDQAVDFVLIYDSLNQLRAELRGEQIYRRILICEDELAGSKSTKAGPIPAGRWVIAFEINYPKLAEGSKTDCGYIISGEPGQEEYRTNDFVR